MSMHQTYPGLPPDRSPCMSAAHVRLPSAPELAALVDIGLGRADIARYFGAPVTDVRVVLECLGVQAAD